MPSRNQATQQQRTQGSVTIAPLGGMNTVDPMTQMPPGDCMLSSNFRSGPYGLVVRKGFKQWCTNIPDNGVPLGVKTIIPLNASERLATTDKLFATTSDGIFDITTPGLVVPTKVVDFPAKQADAGWCSWHNYTNSAGGQFLLVCDLINGYYTYDVALNTWAKITQGGGPGQINGANPDDFCFVTIWKNRVWFVLINSTRAFYLNSVGALTGTVTAFDFGSKFRYGGFLKGIYNWTLDGGAGIDDYLVAISSEGDVVVYQGTDPTTADGFNMRGSWIVGEVPRGRRIADDFGGDLLVASNAGLIPMSKIVSGLPQEESTAFTTYKINPLYRDTYTLRENLFGFEIKYLSPEGLVMVVWPQLTGKEPIQLCMDTTTQSWTIFQGMPILTIDVYKNKSYFGTSLNEIFTYEGGADRALLDTAIVPNGIEFKLLTQFSDLGAPTQFKRVQFIRPVWIVDSVPTYEVQARYDYDIAPVSVIPGYTPLSTALWDASVWDTALWGGGNQIDQPVRGASGMGRVVAIGMKGISNGIDVTMGGINIMWDTGGLL